MPYTPTSWVSGTTPCDAPEMNNLEKQYTEAVNSFNQDFLTAFSLSGGGPSKDGTIATQLDVQAGVWYLLQTDGSLRRRATTATNFSTSGNPSTTMYLDLNPDGTWSWGTSHSGVANYFPVAQVTTNGTSQISTVTDKRTLNADIFPNAFSVTVPPILNISYGGVPGFGFLTQSNHLLQLYDYLTSTYLMQWDSTAGVTNTIGETLSNGTSTALTFANTLGSSNQLVDFQQSYGVFSDNTGSGGATSRLWISTPSSNGEVDIGPRAGSSYLTSLNLFTSLFTIKDANGTRKDTSRVIQSGGAFLGFKDSSGNKLAEMKSGGNFLANGAFQTAGSTSTIATSQTFDSFDYAECYPHDQLYPNGTVVCMGDEGKMTRCTHDNCPAALIVSHNPGYSIGAMDESPEGEHQQPLALVGRVKARSASAVARGKHMVSDGKGGVRPLVKGRWGYALGITLTASDDDGQVGILVGRMYCKGA